MLIAESETGFLRQKIRALACCWQRIISAASSWREILAVLVCVRGVDDGKWMMPETCGKHQCVRGVGERAVEGCEA